MGSQTKILFVCLGNIVRSPLAENIFRQLAEQAEQGSRFRVDSAGTSSWHIGEPPDSRMRRVAAQHGLHYQGSARQVTRQDLANFDVIIAMDRDNRAVLFSLANGASQQEKIHLLREFDPHGQLNSEVPDPYYGGVDGFEETYRIVERSCQGLLEALQDGKLGR